MAVRIKCISKDGGNHENPHVGITSLTWVNEASGESGTSSRLEMYTFVDGGGLAYVLDRYSNKAYLEARISSLGNKYVRTIPDGTTTDNLLNLPEC